ncbi:hypothetical protein [Paenibacillus medicaginis]|uniref:HK97 gp10 family phage protein n=1 Tax=Paenibacillus medicaginis TaxID=1470560 RepID=A0ABV5BVC2_9BACL
MNKQFTNLNSLLKHIQKEAEKSIQSDVSKKVIKKAQDHVDEDVYAVYPDPKEYERSGKLRNSFVVTSVKDGVEITNNRIDVDPSTGEIREIAEIIEYGHDDSEQGYLYPAYYPGSENFVQPRPFMKNTADELNQTGEHVITLKKSLQRKGMDVN